jgi:type II secretory pathway pseudopilin PulG
MPGNKNQRGFTYLWVLATMVLIGISAVVVAELQVTVSRRSDEEQLLFIGQEFRAAIASYHQATPSGITHEYPTSLEQLIKDQRFATPKRHLRRIYIDPMTRHAEWGLLKQAGRIVGVHSLSDVRPLKQRNFEMENTAFENREKYSEWVFTFPPVLLRESKPDQPLGGPQ